MVEVIKKIKLHLTKDESAAVNEFFTYWLLLCDSKANNKKDDTLFVAMCMLCKCIIAQIKIKFDKRLQTTSINHRYTFTPAEAIVLIEFLRNHPIKSENFWLQILRQTIIDLLHPQL